MEKLLEELKKEYSAGNRPVHGRDLIGIVERALQNDESGADQIIEGDSVKEDDDPSDGDQGDGQPQDEGDGKQEGEGKETSDS